MSLPNATAIISTLPNGMRATVKRGSTVASYAVRTSVNEAGNLSLGGLDRLARTNVWTVSADFSPRVSVGDVLLIDNVPAFVIDSMTTSGNLVNRAQVMLCEDTVTINEIEVACQVGLYGEDVTGSLSGFLPEDTQGFFVPESILPDGITIEIETPVVINGEQLLVAKVSRDAKHGILCVTCSRRGAA